MRSLQIDLLFGGCQQPGAFGTGCPLGLLDHVVGAVLRLVDDLGGAFARLAHDDLGTLIGGCQVLFALLSGGKSCCDLASPLLHRVDDLGPHEFHRDHDERDEHDHLHEQREIDVHVRFLAGLVADRVQCVKPAVNGFANVKNSAKPMPIMATASTSAATMNIFTCTIGVSSGWRAAPSRKRPPKRPNPMAVPAAPKPKMMPTASTVMAWTCAMFSIQFS